MQDLSERLMKAAEKEPEILALQEEVAELYAVIGGFEGCPDPHGHVWVFLRSK